MQSSVSVLTTSRQGCTEDVGRGCHQGGSGKTNEVAGDDVVRNWPQSPCGSKDAPRQGSLDCRKGGNGMLH
eukprot:8650524-Alexandrium_andersonii.AAC.1